MTMADFSPSTVSILYMLVLIVAVGHYYGHMQHVASQSGFIAGSGLGKLSIAIERRHLSWGVRRERK